VLEASNAPAGHVVSVCIGPTRQEAQLEVTRPLKFPHPGLQQGPVEVGLFQELGSCVLPRDPGLEGVCDIPVVRSDGSSSQVKLSVRRAGDADPRRGASRSRSKRPKEAPGGPEDLHGQVLERIHGLIHDVLRDQPADPRSFMLAELRSWRREAVEAPAPQDAKRPEGGAMAPRPPDEPHPGRTGRMPVPRQAPERQAEARYSLRLLLGSSTCTAIAEESVRAKVQREAAQRISALAVASARGRVLAEAERDPSGRRGSCVRRVSCVRQSPSSSSSAPPGPKGQALRGPLPMPVVSLTAENAWGEWLSSAPPTAAATPAPTPTASAGPTS